MTNNMANSFVKAAVKQAQTTLTENGAMAYNTTGTELIDLFSTIGVLRTRDESAIARKFANAYNEDALLAVKMLFYSGDIRGGLGERRTFRICLRWLAENRPEHVITNIDLIPYYNRWDSLFCLIGTKAEDAMWALIATTLINDIEGCLNNKNITLLAKWMPSINASSKETRKLARKCIDKLCIKDEKSYRKLLSTLREYLNVTEHFISAQEWSKVTYEKVPSYAMKKYADAFRKHDYERFYSYMKEVQDGKKKINASTLYPYDLVKQYIGTDIYGPSSLDRKRVDDVIEAQWKALPNYIEGEDNVLVMADVSGSMYGNNNNAIATSVGLATYFAERNHGIFSNLFMTFTSMPTYITLRGETTLLGKLHKIFSNDVGYSTNLEAAFELVLETGITARVKKEDMPKAIVVISDMEIDAPRYNNFDFIDGIKAKFNRYGYELPKLILWNVESRKDTFLSQNSDVIKVGGYSESIFKTFLKSLNCSDYEIMFNTLMSERYAAVKLGME